MARHATAKHWTLGVTLLLWLGLVNQSTAQEGGVVAAQPLPEPASAPKAFAVKGPGTKGPVAPLLAIVPEPNAGTAFSSSCGQGCGERHCGERHCRRGRSCQRLREWLTYRPLPVPHECYCRRTCVPCFPHPYVFLAVRYPQEGHAVGAFPEPVAVPVNHVAPAPLPMPAPLPFEGDLGASKGR